MLMHEEEVPDTLASGAWQRARFVGREVASQIREQIFSASPHDE